MAQRCVFTIVAKNYVGLANLLQKSLKQHTQELDFYICVADELDNSDYPENVIELKDKIDIEASLWLEMSFKYNLTEFCTAVKPFAFKYLFKQGYTKVIYMDPDIYVFNSLEPIFCELDSFNVVLTPHVVGMHLDYKGEHDESLILWEGSYNLGFCGLSYSCKVMNMLEWWGNKLKDECFAYKGYPYCYDQKWMVLLNCYFNHDEILISRNLGYNIAPWNYFERKVFFENGQYKVKYRSDDCGEESYPVTFVHFAGYKYKDLIKGEVKRSRLSINDYTDISELLNVYIKEFQNNAASMEKYLYLPYSYDCYYDGSKIEKIHRSIYNGLRKKGYPVGNPYLTGKGTLNYYIHKSHLLTGSQIESYNMASYQGISKKEKMLDIYYRLLKLLLGFKNYLLFQKSLHIYVNPEKQSILLEKYYKNSK